MVPNFKMVLQIVSQSLKKLSSKNKKNIFVECYVRHLERQLKKN